MKSKDLRRSAAIYCSTAVVLSACATASVVSINLLGQRLVENRQTPEGTVRVMPLIEHSSFCKSYRCIISEPIEGNDGDAIWVVLPMTVRPGDALAQKYKGAFFPEVTVTVEKNLILYANLALDTRVRSPMPAATLNLLGNFTRLMLGAPISAQKLSACYRSLEREATCMVGRGTVRVADVPRRYVAAFRTVDDGEGYSVVNYSIGLED